jgi:predicted metal-binding protein
VIGRKDGESQSAIAEIVVQVNCQDAGRKSSLEIRDVACGWQCLTKQTLRLQTRNR